MSPCVPGQRPGRFGIFYRFIFNRFLRSRIRCGVILDRSVFLCVHLALSFSFRNHAFGIFLNLYVFQFRLLAELDTINPQCFHYLSVDVDTHGLFPSIKKDWLFPVNVVAFT